jgi:glycerol-3-phosphate dehydrogenase (NAD(P)+)
MIETSRNPVAVLGCGGWGTALAVHLASTGCPVRLWGRDELLVRDLSESRENSVYLPGTVLPESVEPMCSIEPALSGTRYVVVAVPSHGVRDLMRKLAGYVEPGVTIVSAVKGIEETTLLRMSQVIEEELQLDRPIVVLSGPSFAAEVARGLPTAVVVSGDDEEAVTSVQHDFKSRTFRLYGTRDTVGVEVGGALKNVMAIAAGVVEALGLGHNALSAIITRGLAESTRLACAMGGQRETLSGLSGLGDLVLTCTGGLSRNRRLGLQLGQGQALPEILKATRMVAEGVRTTEAALDLGDQHGVELPITSQMAHVLAGRKTPSEAAEQLMLRKQRDERDG